MDQDREEKVQAVRHRKRLQREIQAQEVLLAGIAPEDYPDLLEYRKTVSRIRNKLRQLKGELATMDKKRGQ